ncbi:uncharacterized protein N0V89_009180 [Didymosphaeria variabile]|uniref:Uncharacterized protein n=1 Tax=Didymosphaeria variabile TaxID=1932322 RepID=A0A9W8XDF8_9PLEO|nr:uncharacterized protein N0V89_009180 [Didymosphaeria variabile]KAJ4347810.1 hypothetical protein N0V89_009180 [Didymosphaeria variabile]
MLSSYRTHLLTPPAPSEDLIEKRLQFETPKLQAWSKIVLYLPKTPKTCTTSLLQTNKQLYAETLATLTRLAANSPDYALDLVILDECLLLPTWTNVPVITTHIDTVHVSFRMSGAYENRQKHRKLGSYQGFMGGDGAGPAMGWQLYAVLERFIKTGAHGETGCPDTHMHVTAKCIRIDVQTPLGFGVERFGEPPSDVYGRRKMEGGIHVLEPDYLADFVEAHVIKLLAGMDYEWFTYGQILFEHVDLVVVCKDGVEHRRCDVAERLRDLGHIPGRRFSAEQLRRYKEDTWQVRKERGLKVLSE